MNELTASVLTVATALVGVAILAVLVSRQSNTTGVISAAAGGFAEDIAAAVSPITGGGSGFGFGGFSGMGAPLVNPYVG